MSIISASTTSTTAYKVTADTTGTLVLQTGSTPTTALTLNTDQSITTAGNLKLGTSGTTYLYGPSTTGRSFVSNSDSTAYIGIYGSAYGSGSNSILSFVTGTSNVMTLDASGRLGIGTTSPSQKLHVEGVGQFVSTNTLYVNPSYDTGVAAIQVSNSAALGFATNNIERGRFDSSGNLLVGYTSGSAKLAVNGAGWISGGVLPSSTGVDNSRIFNSTSGTTGTVTLYIGNAAITTSSDVRLKENIVDTQRNATEILSQLRVVDHTWNDPSDTCENNRNSRGVWMGLIAQEAQPIIPWLVNKPLADEDEEGNPQYWHMDYGYAVPLLVKAHQEQQAIIDAQQAALETLTNRISALENK